MRLTLSVITLQEQAPFTAMTHTFDQAGGSVGRHQRADWVLLDDRKFLSGEHFKVHCDGKSFFLVDTSTNGTLINDSIHPLGKDNSHTLIDGDQIKLGEYVLLVSIFAGSASSHSDFPVDTASQGNNKEQDPFFSSGGSFDSSAAPDNSQDGSLQKHDPYEASSKSSFVDPNMAGTFGQASTVEDSNDPFFSSGDSFSPNETPFSKEDDKNIMEHDTPINIHTPLPSVSIKPAPQKKPQPAQVPAEVFADIIKEEEEPDAFDFLDSDAPEDTTQEDISKEQASAENVAPVVSHTKKKPTEPARVDVAEIAEPEIESEPVDKKPAVIDDGIVREDKPAKKEKKQTPKTDSSNAKKATETKSKETATADATGNSEALKMLLKGAGITQKHLPSEVPNETFKIIGHALKEVLQGTIDLLRARAETKNHLHLDRTIIGRVENNPLKFMPNAEQVIIHLLTNEDTNKTYTPLDKALEEAFDDIKAHQFAMTVATQNALRGVIKQHFSPKNLADNMAKEHPISAKIPLQRQAKLWNMFESLYDDVEKEAAESFQTLLDNEVSSAYEKQLMELKSLRISNNNTDTDDFPV